MKPALLVVDIQNVWLDGTAELKASVEKRIDVINGAIRWFRENKLPIVVIYHEDKEEGAVSGTRPFEVHQTVGIEEDDFRVTKHYPNSFNKTGLEAIIRRMGCDTVLIVGLSASGCALATYFGAMDHDIHPYMVKGGIASHNEDHVRFAEDVCETLSLEAFDRTLR
jgi:nicotinamidase-related amidase